MERVTSRRIKNNVLSTEKSCEDEKKILAKNKISMNKRKGVCANGESHDEVVKRHFKKMKNDKVSKDEKDKMQSTYLINTRNKERSKKESARKGVNKEKRSPLATSHTKSRTNSGTVALTNSGTDARVNPVVKRVTFAKSNHMDVKGNGEKHSMESIKRKESNFNNIISSCFKGSSGTVNRGISVAGNGNRTSMDSSRNVPNITANRTGNLAGSNASNNLVNHASHNLENYGVNLEVDEPRYLNMKNDIECNLASYKRDQLEKRLQEKIKARLLRPKKLSFHEKILGMRKSILQRNNKEYAWCKNGSSIERTNSKMYRLEKIHNSILKRAIELNENFMSNKYDLSFLFNGNSNYESRKRGEMHNAKLSSNMRACRHTVGVHPCYENFKKSLSISKKKSYLYDHLNSSSSDSKTKESDNEEKEMHDMEGSEQKCDNFYFYSFEERNREFMESLKYPFRKDFSKDKASMHKELLRRSFPRKIKGKIAKSRGKLFFKKEKNAYNLRSYNFKRGLQMNRIRNAPNVLECGPGDEGRNNGRKRCYMVPFANRKRNVCFNSSRENSPLEPKITHFCAMYSDYFEGEKLFRRPKTSYSSMLFEKNKNEETEFSGFDNDDLEIMPGGVLNHQDLLINKRAKTNVHKDENGNDIHVEYEKNFWNDSKRDYYKKYCKSSVQLKKSEVEKLRVLIDFGPDDDYTIDSMFRFDNYYANEEEKEKEYLTDNKLKNFNLELINGFLYDKQSLYEREMMENQKILSRVSFNHKNYDVKIDKLLNLFPRDFMKRYKIVKKLGEGVYGKVFKAESLEDSYLHFAVKVLRYFWPNFKYKFGSEEFAINEYNIMRILFHPNLVCLIDSFRVHTYRKGNVKTHRNQKTITESLSAEYDFSFQRHRKPEKVHYSPSRHSVERNNQYKNLVARSGITIEDLERNLFRGDIGKMNEHEQNNVDLYSSSRNLKMALGVAGSKGDDGTYDSPMVMSSSNSAAIIAASNAAVSAIAAATASPIVTPAKGRRNEGYSCTGASSRKDGKRGRGNTELCIYPTKKKMKLSPLKDGVLLNQLSRKKRTRVDKLTFRKHSKKLKKIESKSNDHIENWDLFLVIEKCDCSLNDILNKTKKKHNTFIHHIKQCTAQYLPSERIDMSYDHIYNYVKYVYLPLKKIENRSFYPEMPSLTETQTKVIIYQMLQGVNHFHKKFVIHRDIKPANTLIKNIQYLSDGLNDPKEWIVKIADFGLGVYDHFLKAETKDCNIITLQYRPPEILCNSTLYNYSVDIWSVGITMCECLLGFVPVTSKFESSVLFKILVFRGLPDDNFDDLLEKEFLGELPRFKIDRIKMLEMIFTDIYGRRILSNDGLDLIDQFLSYDYKNRITADDALKHRWFKDVHLHLNEDLLKYYKKNGTYYF
ncbi:protein kinase, putative [Plasmodium ovale wallikeri]|uniref:non-specific serine/threonine protein kinase n=2 Tax=Plasmodium ovale TaxID=36330 RepID=A0A1A8YSF7_PLAOA|nr:protein kinase, putative [Plasmodium ovale wallikeri]SBT34826.1 protein kinase, putative [Plasmodium ovale wallikeri]SBT76799.1 cdc2-related protein kinase 4, putative [Plasmodium ovale]